MFNLLIPIAFVINSTCRLSYVNSRSFATRERTILTCFTRRVLAMLIYKRKRLRVVRRGPYIRLYRQSDFFHRKVASKRSGMRGESMRCTRDFSSAAYQMVQDFPFRPPAQFFRRRETSNVNWRTWVEINSALARFTWRSRVLNI